MALRHWLGLFGGCWQGLTPISVYFFFNLGSEEIANFGSLHQLPRLEVFDP